MAETKLGPQTLEEAQANVREMIARLDAEIQSETEKFMAEREQVMAYPIESFADQEWNSHRLRQLTLAFEQRVYPLRQHREVMVNAIVRTLDIHAPAFYLELQPIPSPGQCQPAITPHSEAP